MVSAAENAVGIVGYLALFGGVGLVFVFVNLLLGRFLRPNNPNVEKLEIYECGEPTIGSSFVQFDLRFYVVALVFIIFDVEVAFLFPWATVFGKLTNLAHDNVAIVQTVDGSPEMTPVARGVYQELGVDSPTIDALAGRSELALHEGVYGAGGELEFAGLEQMVTLALVAVAVFFVVLLIGFAYEWRTGALDWVRAVSKSPARVAAPRAVPGRGRRQESVLSP